MILRFLRKRRKASRTVVQKIITLNGLVIPYSLTISDRANCVRISISKNAQLRVSVPYFLPEKKMESYMQEKSNWILSKLTYYKSLPPQISQEDSRKEYQLLKKEASDYVHTRITELNRPYKFSYNEIHIKNHRTLWGSCSRKGNLNFNYKIIQLPERLADYIIVHELCHLQEFNHSKRFWDLVAQTIPNHVVLRAELRSTGLRSQ